VRWAASSATVSNNLLFVKGGGSRQIWKRDGATITEAGNVTGAQAAWFVDVTGADLHLSGPVSGVVDQAVPGAAADDFDGDPRGAQPDVGADELGGGGPGTGGSVRDASWGSIKGGYRG
jgi:hypothetical protein